MREQRNILRFCSLLPLVAMFVVTPASAQEECAPQADGERISSRQFLRQVTLDLLGRVPSLEEWNRLNSGTSVSTLRTEFLESEEYFAQVRERHRDILWANFDAAQETIVPYLRRIHRAPSGVWYNPSNASRVRGGGACLNEPQSGYAPNGRPLAMNGSKEGYVMVTPYWDAEPIPVCAFDVIDANDFDCSVYSNSTAYWTNCGCGPNLRGCISLPGGIDGSPTRRGVRDAFSEEPARIFESIVRERRPYHEAFTTQRTFVNGPIVHYYNYMAGLENPYEQNGIVYENYLGALPSMTWNDADNWQQIERESMHSGVLTTPAYLLRFGSNRGRVNHFYRTFLCQPFLPSAAGLPQDDNPHPDLQQRDGCENCHLTIEPAAHYFGRWRTNGQNGFLNNDTLPLAPTDDWRCSQCTDRANSTCNGFCEQYAVTMRNTSAAEGETLSPGALTGHYLTEAQRGNLDIGPSGLVAGREDVIAACTVQTLASELLGRDLSQNELNEWVPSITSNYVSEGYDYTTLVQLLMDDVKYQTVR